MTTFARHKRQIKLLNMRYEEYWQKEFRGRNVDYISNPENFTDKTYFHQANSTEDKFVILKSGFNADLVTNENRGLGAGLYMGRDKTALINFYSQDFNNPLDVTITVRGNFKFFDAVSNPLPQRNIREFVLNQGYDGIRYYDKDATGEEFVLYRYKNISFSIC